MGPFYFLICRQREMTQKKKLGFCFSLGEELFPDNCSKRGGGWEVGEGRGRERGRRRDRKGRANDFWFCLHNH